VRERGRGSALYSGACSGACSSPDIVRLGATLCNTSPLCNLMSCMHSCEIAACFQIIGVCDEGNDLFFYLGTGTPKTAITGGSGGSARCTTWRDYRTGTAMDCETFAVELLLKGVSLDTVSMLLGHKSIKTTERHYAPWIKIGRRC
jgi:hypothetical protein